MTTEQRLLDRCGGQCELCASQSPLSVYAVPPTSTDSVDTAIMLCATCKGQVEDPASVEVNHWHCLNDSMWSPVPAVQVMAWRMLKRLAGETWAQDQLDMLYLDEETLAWAEAGVAQPSGDDAGPQHRDSNGTVLAAGDTVTLIKDLAVKGAGFTAKRGTTVKGISLTDNPEQIEGRVNGVRIVLLTQFLKKVSS